MRSVGGDHVAGLHVEVAVSSVMRCVAMWGVSCGVWGEGVRACGGLLVTGRTRPHARIFRRAAMMTPHSVTHVSPELQRSVTEDHVGGMPCSLMFRG